jgi:hypothetical protein
MCWWFPANRTQKEKREVTQTACVPDDRYYMFSLRDGIDCLKTECNLDIALENEDNYLYSEAIPEFGHVFSISFCLGVGVEPSEGDWQDVCLTSTVNPAKIVCGVDPHYCK